MSNQRKNTDKIPTSKVARATALLKTGAKVGGNYLKHYVKKQLFQQDEKNSLHEANAEEVYETLSKLKGSALKAAQMMSMDQNMMPSAYVERFQQAQYSVPPLSYPLVVRTFIKNFGVPPQELFDYFSKEAVKAASIGQVHEAYKDGQRLAVKVQYPGVADSVKSDLRLVKPFAKRLLNMQEKDIELYFQEVEEKLLEETNYELELKRSIELTQACSHLEGLFFPAYYPEYSCRRILTMSWIEGKHLKEFLAGNPSQEIRNRVGQILWDFYHFQIHELKMVHADPHPGNFFFTEDGRVGVIDFGCIKVIPNDFYEVYFKVLDERVMRDATEATKLLHGMGFLHADDSPDEKRFFTNIFKELVSMLGKPFRYEQFDFGNSSYFREIYELSERIASMKELKESKKARGSRHTLYINRTYFGLYNILNQLGATIRVTKPAFLSVS
ncbi:MAG: ABC transporter [Thermonema sp.]|nr:MAG: ABC transporter [Thermonema sp.]